MLDLPRAAPAVAALAFSLLAAAPQRFEPCSLIAKDDAAQAVGSPITGVFTRTLAGARTCMFETGVPGRSVRVTLYEYGSADEAAAAFNADVAGNAKIFVKGPLAVPSLGDAAVAFSHVLWVRKRTAIVVFNVVDAQARGETLEQAKALARKALVKLSVRDG